MKNLRISDMSEIPHKTLSEVVEAWNKDEQVVVPEMGLGLEFLSYEAAIHTLSFAIAEDCLKTNVEGEMTEFDKDFGEEIAINLDKEFGFSGAMVGAAKNVATVFMRQGYLTVLSDLPVERLVKIRKSDVDTQPSL